MKRLLVKAGRKISEPYGRLSVLRHGLWFVDIPRTSSSSIRAELGKSFGRAYGKRNIIEEEYRTPQIFEDHMPAQRMRDVLGKAVWNKIFTFTIVRNPWDRTYSMYNYRKKVDEIPREWNFRDYVIALQSATVNTPFFQYRAYRYGAADYLVNENGEIIVDYIARFENRVHDLNVISSRIKSVRLGACFAQSASPRNEHYSAFYDVETKEVIRRLYAKDIELFGYTFESGA